MLLPPIICLLPTWRFVTVALSLSFVVTALCSGANVTEAGCRPSAAPTAVFIVQLVSQEGLAVKTFLHNRGRTIDHTTLLDKRGEGATNHMAVYSNSLSNDKATHDSRLVEFSHSLLGVVRYRLHTNSQCIPIRRHAYRSCRRLCWSHACFVL